MLLRDHTGRGGLHAELTADGAYIEIQDKYGVVFGLFLRTPEVQRLALHLLSQGERAVPEPRCEV